MASSPTFSSGRGLRLERAVGVSASWKSCAAVNPRNDQELAYPVGCVVLRVDACSGRQKGYLRMVKPVASLAFSRDGRYIAIGEKGHNPGVTIWDLESEVRIAELKGHRIGISCLSFSRDGKMLASVGFEHDDQLILWNWVKEVPYCVEKLSEVVHGLDFAENGKEIVSVGVKHVRFWEIESEAFLRKPDEQESAIPELKVSVVQHQAALMANYENSTFTDVVCGSGDLSGDTFLVTDCGSLICVASNRLMEKGVVLETDSAFSISIDHKNRLLCGCANGVCRVFDGKSFEFIATLPLPKRIDIPVQTQKSQQIENDEGPVGSYPDTVFVGWIDAGQSAIVIYADRSLFSWDLSEVGVIRRKFSLLSHTSGISAIVALPSTNLVEGQPDGLIATCSNDRRLRFWKISSNSKRKSMKKGPWQNEFSNELLKEIVFGKDEGPSFKCLTVSWNGEIIACGDKQGGLIGYSLVSGKTICDDSNAHSAEILCMSFSPETGNGELLLVTGSRDRQINMYDASSGTALKKTQVLKNHSANVTGVKFSMDGKKLLSTGCDKCIVISELNEDGKFSRTKSVNVPYGTIHDFEIDATNKYFCTSGQDKKINIWLLSNGKFIRSYKSKDDSGELNVVKLDPAGTFLGTGSNDKSLRVFDFYSGDCIANAAGHSEPITGLAFTNDCKRLISVGWDGCMFVWRLAPEITSAIRARKREIETHFSNQGDEENKRENEEEAQNKNADKKDTNLLFATDKLPAWARTGNRDANHPEGTIRVDEEELAEEEEILLSGKEEEEESPLENKQFRSLTQERAAMKLQEQAKDTEEAVRRMRDKLKNVGVLEATMKKRMENEEHKGQQQQQHPVKVDSKPLSIPVAAPSPILSEIAHGTEPRNPNRNAWTPGTPMRTAEDARSACEHALQEVRTALGRTAEIFHQVEMLDTNLEESLTRSQRDEFTASVLQTSRSHVQTVMSDFKSQLSSLVSQELTSVTEESALNQSMFVATPGKGDMGAMMAKLNSISSMLEKVVEKKEVS